MKKISRRTFVKGSLSSLALAALPAKVAFGQTPMWTRLEWQQYRLTSQYPVFINAIRTMRANTNAGDPNSWTYWSNIHQNVCPHGVPYFLSWHRGYIYQFEQRLRIVSGDSTLTLPYWDYYTNPNVPADFTDPATSNPLYVPRTNTNVYDALTMAPFAPDIVNFENGRPNAFETLIEWGPHNPVHNILGGVMSTMQAPIDPIFWLHHANIDRLWHAWALPDGKNMPWWQDPYWSGTLFFADNLTLQRDRTYHIAWLNYTYDNLNRPADFPPAAQAAKIIRVQARIGGSSDIPPVVAFPSSDARAISATRLSLGGARSINLGDSSASIRIPLNESGASQMQSIMSATTARQAASGQYKSVHVVLDGVNLTGNSKDGGYFYNVYVNLPRGVDLASSRHRYLIGSIGPFEIAAATHHGPAMFSFPATEQLAGIGDTALQNVTVSLVRGGGKNTSRTAGVHIDELRVEVSTEDPSSAPRMAKPASACYC